MDYEKLKYSVEDGIAIIEMTYLKNLNAIDEQMADELNAVLDEADKNTDVKVIVLKGAERAFSAGGDIGYFYDLIKAGGDINMDGLIAKVGIVADKMKRMGKIIIASVSGVAAGAGVSLALGCDFIISDEEAKYILAFVNLGLVPDTGATYLLSKSIGVARTIELATTGRPLDAKEAKEWGLVYKLAKREELDDVTMKFAKRISQGPLMSYKNIKKQIYDANFKDYKERLDNTEVPTQRECANSNDFKEGCKAFMEKRKAEFRGN